MAVAVAAIAAGAFASPSQPSHEQAADNQKQTAASERGTEATPLVVETFTKPDTEATRAKNEERERTKANVDRKLVELTGNLSLFTGGLFVATILLAFGTFALWWETRRAVQDAAGSNEKLFALNAAQADLAKLQHGLAREVFYVEHRPRLLIKDVFFLPDGDLTFEILNVGGSPATVIAGWFALGNVTDHRHFKDPGVGEVTRVKGMTYERGELRSYKKEIPPEADIARRLTDRLAKPGESGGNFYFYGAFSYADGRGEEVGSTYLSVFRRKWNPLNTQFERTGNPDHEFAD
ncbi:hypothetical protein [Phenylobacterium sp.]|uniref:hypothetical protein n=1 Tax=Phenylobacterium sp. TaxID=1871053 RepID=UPI0025DDAA70|nr:hypothetical protein [Phenylobacterium sp.]